MTTQQHMEKLYRINDVLESLAHEFGVTGRFDTEQDYDYWLNNLTHLVAEEMGIK